MRSARVASSRRTRSSISGTRMSSASTIRRVRMLSLGFGAVATGFRDVGVLDMIFPTPYVEYGNRDEGGFRTVAKIAAIERIFSGRGHPAPLVLRPESPQFQGSGMQTVELMTMNVQTSLTDRAAALAGVRRDIAEACREAGRDPAGVTLVAISKTFAADAIVPVI